MKRKYKLIFVFVTLVILIGAIFVVITIQDGLEIFSDTKEEDVNPLVVKILADEYTGVNPHAVNFNPLVINNKGNIEYKWDFGDGGTSNDENPIYTYKELGSYICSLSVTDGTGRNSIDRVNITVLHNNPPLVKIMTDKTTGFRPETIHFDADVFDIDGDDVTYKWEIKYPPSPILPTERVDTYNEKNFSIKFWRPGMHVVTLTVTDETGNSVTEYLRIDMKGSKIEVGINSLFYYSTILKLPRLIGRFIHKTFEPQLFEYLNSIWLDLPTNFQNITLIILKSLGLEYIPPIEKAELKFSDSIEFNLSADVEIDGSVLTKVNTSSSFKIINIDSSKTAWDIYITLKDPTSENEGLHNDIEKKNLEVSVDEPGLSKKLFYDGEYRNYIDCYCIENLAPGDESVVHVTVTLSKADAGTFEKGIYECTLYVYQDHSLTVDEVAFTIIL